VQPQGQRKRSTVTGLLVYGAFLAAIAAWFAFYQFSSYVFDSPQRAGTAKTAQTDHRSGDILIPLGVDRACRHIAFDNVTGGFHEEGVLKCGDDGPGTNSTVGRMNAIKGAFSRK
jgi:hypothetical protein